MFEHNRMGASLRRAHARGRGTYAAAVATDTRVQSARGSGSSVGGAAWQGIAACETGQVLAGTLQPGLSARAGTAP